MISAETKEQAVVLIQEAVASGARVKQACEILELPFRTYLRWRHGAVHDRRPDATRTIPRALSIEEIERFYRCANEPRFRDKTPGQIVAILLEEGTYFGSERTLYRILAAKQALVSRTETRAPGISRKPPELTATGPNQVWTWDITWLPTDVKGVFLYAYAIIDIFSRAIVGWSVEDEEHADHAKALFARVVRERKVHPRFVHADNGGPMRGLSLVAFLTHLRVGLSYSRPRVSDDNPFIESFFRTVKYHVGYPKYFPSLAFAREWLADFIAWYNTDHRHSGIGYVTPDQKHHGMDIALFELRQTTLNSAATFHPERFVKGPRTVTPIRTVRLNKAS